MQIILAEGSLLNQRLVTELKSVVQKGTNIYSFFILFIPSALTLQVNCQHGLVFPSTTKTECVYSRHSWRIPSRCFICDASQNVKRTMKRSDTQATDGRKS